MGMTRLDVPVGTVIDYAGTSVPDGYLECDGSAISRTAYPALFAAIGTTWGAGDGSTTFNLPNLGGRTCIGKGARNVGDTGGAESILLTTDHIPSHAHQVPSHGHGNDISFGVDWSGYISGGITGGSHGHWVNQNNSSGTYFFTSGTEVNNYGLINGGGFANRPIISTSNTNHGNRLYATATTHSHDLPSHSHSLTKYGSVWDCGAFNTGNAGGGQSHDNMQPYAVIRKVIRAA